MPRFTSSAHFWCLSVVLAAVMLSFSRSASAEEPESVIYSLTIKDIVTQEEVSLSDYKGKVLLIVNVASECGYTAAQYPELVRLQEKFDKSQFEILAFPCNQFGEQEPMRNSRLHKHIADNYQPNFRIFSKINTIGEQAHPLYRWLKEQSSQEPNWNFCKYLVSKTGKFRRFASAWDSPLVFEDEIAHTIKGVRVAGRNNQHHEL